MIKVIGCLLIIIGCTYIGFMYSENFNKRVLQLNELEKSIIQLRNEIIYIYTTLPEAFLNVSQKSIDPIRQFYLHARNLLINNQVNSVYEAFRLSIKENEDKLYLTDIDIKILMDLAKNLGESDIEGQINIFELAIKNLEKQIKTAENLRNKNLKMYRYLGFTIGAVIVIILI